jgi:thiol-disulfide isomerase/thioredoxin
MLWGGLAIVVAVFLGLIVSVQSGASGSYSNFRVVAYQGQDILGGDEVDFSQVFRHGKPVILNFWAGLCPPCRAEMPGFQRVYDDLGDKYVMVGVDVGPFLGLGSHDDARRFLKEFDIRYPTAYAVSRDPVRAYGVQSMPTTVFLTPDGKIFDKRIGLLPEDQLRSKLQDLLDASSS